MAATGTVGILRALLTADAATYQKTLKQSADATKAFGQSVAKMGETAQKVSPQLTRMEKAFAGDKLLYSANNLTRAITNIGGAAKLTAAEQEKVNRQLTTAIDKYRVLGQQAPKAMVDLEKATRQAGDSAGFLNTKMVAIGTAIGSFVGVLAARGISSIVQTGLSAFTTAEQIDDMSKKLAISTDAVQEFQYIADQTGTTLEAFARATLALQRNLGAPDQGLIDLLNDLGLSFKELRTARPEDAVFKVLEALQKVDDQNRMVSDGVKLMSKSFTELIPALGEDLDQMREKTQKWSQAEVESLANAKQAWDDLWNSIVKVTGIPLAKMMSAWNDVFTAWNKSGGDMFAFLKEDPLQAETRKRQESMKAAAAERTRRLNVQRQAARLAAAAENDLAEATEKTTKTTDKWTEARKRERQAIEEATQGMVWWLASMKTAPALITSIGDSLTSGFLPAVQMSTDVIMAFAAQGQDSILKFHKTLVSQDVTAPQERILTFWRDEFPDVVKDAFEGMTRGMSYALSDMLTGLRGFKDGFLDIWRSIRAAFSDILGSMLNQFISGFLKQMLLAMGGQSLATKMAGWGLGGLAGGAAAGGTAAAAAAGGTVIAGTGGSVVLGGAIGGTAAGGAGLGATIAGLATNPFTIAAAGAGLLGLGIWKKGWFRGGEEGTKVNPARDRFLAQFGGFQSLASLLTSVTGEPGGGRLFTKLRTADTMEEFTSASQNILTLLQRRGAMPISPNESWRLRMPQPQLAAAVGVGVPAAAYTPSAVPATSAAAPVTMNVTIQAWDHQDMTDAFREQILPRLKDALQMNQAGLRTVVAGV